jgi:hypothetical protein
MRRHQDFSHVKESWLSRAIEMHTIAVMTDVNPAYLLIT